MQQKTENYQILCEALEEHFVELRDKDKDKFKKALQQPQDLSMIVTGKPAKSPKTQALLEDIAINSPLLTIDALHNDGEGKHHGLTYGSDLGSLINFLFFSTQSLLIIQYSRANSYRLY